ncbi:peptide-methionine (S)-S-oxide reductase MsrA [Gallaecimonas mangrovi]|uniref:peptide-methionine (S)-S-oxide reductase MsrA n=1 Tax=Gallaecimonas mangrovi TaxID=2291597 RepID=UPI000E1FE6FD|nr:peptide-methionine (S)-S-oxide reductase MsrA [Gallaecimonas mangrovi]
MSQVTLGGGCFWCLEAVYQRLPGIERIISGYAGGHIPNPTYAEVCRGESGHAEVVDVKFNPQLITLDQLFTVFFQAHDPTTLNRQGSDIGPQYRSIILYRDDAQLQAAKTAMSRVQRFYDLSLVTELSPLTHFYAAEREHHDYFNRHRSQPYCQWVIQPKLSKLQLAE